MITNQVLLFLLYILIGLIIGIVFDFFRSLRKSIKTSNIATYIEDIVFWIIVGILIIAIISKFSFGELRFYILVGLLIGLLLHFLIFSNILIKFNVKVLNTIIRISKAINYYVHKIFLKPIKFIIINIRKINIFKTNKKFKKKEGI